MTRPFCGDSGWRGEFDYQSLNRAECSSTHVHYKKPSIPCLAEVAKVSLSQHHDGLRGCVANLVRHLHCGRTIYRGHILALPDPSQTNEQVDISCIGRKHCALCILLHWNSRHSGTWQEHGLMPAASFLHSNVGYFPGRFTVEADLESQVLHVGNAFYPCHGHKRLPHIFSVPKPGSLSQSERRADFQ